MNIYTNIPYTYRIGWSKTGMKYYGVRYAKDCHPSDLFVTYFTSSTYVAEYIKEHGLPDIIEVRKTFLGENRVQKSLLWESKVILKMNAPTRSDYLNKWGYKGNWDHDSMVKHKINTISAMNTEEMKEQCKNHATKCWEDEEYREKQRIAKSSAEYKQKLSASIAEGMANSQNVARGKNHYRYDQNVYSFIHETGIIEHLTKNEMIAKYSLSDSHLPSLANGKLKSHKGWKMLRDTKL
jgi:hypothetical protein